MYDVGWARFPGYETIFRSCFGFAQDWKMSSVPRDPPGEIGVEEMDLAAKRFSSGRMRHYARKQESGAAALGADDDEVGKGPAISVEQPETDRDPVQ